MKDMCLSLVQEFWWDGILTLVAARGVIRLLPKSGALEFLNNWRPITLLTLIYKILSKILANRIKPFMDLLVDSQQAGFIPGRSIIDNILAFNVGKEFVRLRKLLAIFLKLDFFKAYNRLNHIFLKEVLLALGFSQLIVSLILGLVCNGSTKVHANGLIMLEFDLGRGVR